MSAIEFYESSTAWKKRLFYRVVFAGFFFGVFILLLPTVLRYERSNYVLMTYMIFFIGAIISISLVLRSDRKLITLDDKAIGFRLGYVVHGIFQQESAWAGVAWKDIRYFDFPSDGKLNPKDALYISYNDDKGRVRNFILPIAGLRRSDLEAFVKSLRRFWPDIDRQWQEKLADRKQEIATLDVNHI